MIGRSVVALSIAVTILGVTWAAQRPGPPKEGLIASIRGPALYRAYCAACHGSGSQEQWSRDIDAQGSARGFDAHLSA